MNAAVSSTTGHPQGAARSVRQFDYIAEMMQLALDDTPVLKIKGRVTQVIGTIIKAVVPTVKVGEVCVLKNHATQTMQFCADTAVQILGGMGFMRGTLSERIYREVKVLTIGGGTEEIMKELAARQWRRLCVELRHLQRTEVLEVEEGFAKGQKGSSAMPHKKNPISAENMSGLSRLLRTNALASLENQALWHERDISHSSVERVIMPDSTILADYVLTRLTKLLDGLVVKPERMRENMERSYGLYFSQRVLTALIATGLPRQQAYEAVQRLAMQSWESRTPFPELVRGDADMSSRLGEAALAELFDPAYYLQHEDEIFARVFKNAAANKA